MEKIGPQVVRLLNEHFDNKKSIIQVNLVQTSIEIIKELLVKYTETIEYVMNPILKPLLMYQEYNRDSSCKIEIISYKELYRCIVNVHKLAVMNTSPEILDVINPYFGVLLLLYNVSSEQNMISSSCEEQGLILNPLEDILDALLTRNDKRDLILMITNYVLQASSLNRCSFSLLPSGEVILEEYKDDSDEVGKM